MYEDEEYILSYEMTMAALKAIKEATNNYLSTILETDNDLFDLDIEKYIKFFIVEAESYIPMLNRLLDQPKELFSDMILERLFDTKAIKEQKEQIKALESEFNRINETYKGKLTKEDIKDIFSVIQKSFEISEKAFEVCESSRLRTKQLTHLLGDKNIGYA